MSEHGGYVPDDSVDGEPTYPTYAQYGQPQYGQPPHGQPPYGQPQYGQPPGPWAKASGRLIVALIGAVVLIGVLAIVGVAVFTDDGSSSQGAPAGPTGFPTSSLATPPTVPPTRVPTGTSPGVGVPSIVPTGTSGATLAGINFFSALSTHNFAAINALACSGTALGLTQARVDQIIVALPIGPAVVSGSSATINGDAVHSDGSRAAIVLRERESGTQWCLTAASGG